MMLIIFAVIIIAAVVKYQIKISERKARAYRKTSSSYSSSYTRPAATTKQTVRPVDNSRLLPNYVVIDTETTGLEPKIDRIIQLAAVKYTNHNEYEAKAWLINPGIPISPEASKVNNIHDSDVAGKPSFDDIADEFLAFVGNSVLVGYNIQFDKKFIEYELGEELKNNIVDCYYIARNTISGTTSYKLTSLAKHFNISTENAHDALQDCLHSAVLRLIYRQRHCRWTADLIQLLKRSAKSRLLGGYFL